MKLELDADVLRCAMLFTAKSHEPRKYLHGVHIDGQGYIESSDGHRLFRAYDAGAEELGGSEVIIIHGKIPAAARKAFVDTCKLRIGGDGIITFANRIDQIISGAVCLFEIVKVGVYPKTNNFFDDFKAAPTECLAVNFSYLADLEKACKALRVDHPSGLVEFAGAHTKPIKFTFRHPSNAALMLMLMRP